MLIGGLEKLSLGDFTGKTSCRVFLVGCNFRCPWCYVPQFVEVPKDFKPIAEKAFFHFLKTNRPFLDGCIIDGGEPCLHQDLPQFCQRIKGLGYSIRLDTNGSQPPMLHYLIINKLIDSVSMDVKAPKDKYSKVVGLEGFSFNYILKNIEASIRLLFKSGIDYEFRTTLTPLLTKEDILKIARWLKSAKRYCLKQFDSSNLLDPRFQHLEPYPKDYIYKIKEAVSPFFNQCVVK